MTRAIVLFAYALSGGCAASGGLDITGGVADDTGAPPAVDTPAGDPVDTVEGEVEDPALLGLWRSTGDDIAELLSGPPSFFVRVDATFRADSTYTVEGEDRDGATYTFDGTWEVDVRSTPRAITNHQESPYVTTATGIYRVTGAGVLTLDIIDTSLGSPATAEGGFGSSSAGDVNVQTYRKVR